MKYIFTNFGVNFMICYVKYYQYRNQGIIIPNQLGIIMLRAP